MEVILKQDVLNLGYTNEKVNAFLPTVNELLESSGGGAMVTLEQVNIIRYSHGKE